MHPMLNIAVKAARRAGQIINRASLDLDRIQVSKKQHNDFVTEVDKASEAAIIETLTTAYPKHSILAEESGETDKESEFQWIIDPLDGTTNFIHGFQYYCVSIALAHKGIITQAVVYDPTRNDLFTASRGSGAYLNERRIRVGKLDRLGDALVGTGFPFREGDGLEAYGKLFTQMTEACAGLRRPGAAALDLANVAAGRLDAFFEQGIKAWDVAASSLLITEAGGLVGNYTGESDFKTLGFETSISRRISKQLSQRNWWLDVGTRRQPEPSLVFITRGGKKTGTDQTEVHVLSGHSRFHRFSLHTGTELPESSGKTRQFVYQSEGRGGAVLMTQIVDGRLKLVPIPLP